VRRVVSTHDEVPCALCSEQVTKSSLSVTTASKGFTCQGMWSWENSESSNEGTILETVKSDKVGEN